MIRDPIMVTGCLRSGTSLVTGYVHHCGAWAGDVVPGGPGNPRGFFENPDIKSGVIKPMLEERGIDPVAHWPLIGQYAPPAGRRAALTEILWGQGYREGPWVLKSCAVLWMLSEWLEMFPNAVWIATDRAHAEIVDSCRRAPFLSEPPCGFETMVRHYEAAIATLRSRVTVYSVSTARLAAGDVEGSGMIDALGAAWLERTPEADAWVDSSLFTQRCHGLSATS